MSSSSTSCTRAYASHQPTWQRFILRNDRPSSLDASHKTTTHAYNRQYSHMCTRRLAELGPKCVQANSSSQGELIDRIIDVKEGVVSTIVGTFLKEMPNRPLFVDPTAALFDDDEDSFMRMHTSVKTCTSYCSANDLLVLEDESGRVELLFTKETRIANPLGNGGGSNRLSVHQITSGVVAAVTGVVASDSGGVMTVHSVTFPKLGPHKTTPRLIVSPTSRTLRPAVLDEESKKDEGGSYGPLVMLVSGLQTTLLTDHDKDSCHALRTELLIDFVAGNLPNLEHEAANIARVIIAGNSTGPYPCAERLLRANRKLFSGVVDNVPDAKKSKANTPTAAEMAVRPIKELDRLLCGLVKSCVAVDVIPGCEDPTNTNWPQQPLHKCLLPNSLSLHGASTLVKRAPNPYEATIGSRLFLGTDGLNVKDLAQYMRREGEDLPPMSEMELLQSTMMFAHIAPSAPDSLASFPFLTEDPFIIKTTPHIYFCGNCESYESKLVTTAEGASCRLICVPSFATTCQVVLVNLETLESQCLTFEDHYMSTS